MAVESSESADLPVFDRDVACPCCGYNLRALTTPRCPECGLTFSVAQIRSGVLRWNVPTWLDRCDPWQPHQVVLRSLWELWRGALRPGRLLRQLDLEGPLLPAVLMLVVGVGWLWVLGAALAAAAILVHTVASPAAAVRVAALVWAPRMAVVCLPPALVGVLCALLPFVLGIPLGGWRRAFRLGAYWVPAVCLWGVVPLGVGMLVVPDFALELRWAAPATVLIVAAVALLRARTKALRGWQAGLLVVVLVVMGVVMWGLGRVLPGALELPLWVHVG
ncbi:MAG: hypothetical protein KKB50_04220 [Planctomycetes bacterium]|nr:hypothetical protein [Planctomycetota bacterium]